MEDLPPSDTPERTPAKVIRASTAEIQARFKRDLIQNTCKAITRYQDKMLLEERDGTLVIIASAKVMDLLVRMVAPYAEGAMQISHYSPEIAEKPFPTSIFWLTSSVVQLQKLELQDPETIAIMRELGVAIAQDNSPRR